MATFEFKSFLQAYLAEKGIQLTRFAWDRMEQIKKQVEAGEKDPQKIADLILQEEDIKYADKVDPKELKERLEKAIRGF